MLRKIIKIDAALCSGCGLCAKACHEGAIEMADGKAVLTRENYCDGLGDCLPTCPTGAISFETREAPAYDEAAVKASKLRQWPVQIKLVPVAAQYFENADLLIAADCTGYAYENFHRDFMRGHTVLIGCPKLDEGDYAEKLTAILNRNKIRSVTLTRMLVPCCGGMERALRQAIAASGRQIPWRVVTIDPEGNIVNERKH